MRLPTCLDACGGLRAGCRSYFGFGSDGRPGEVVAVRSVDGRVIQPCEMGVVAVVCLSLLLLEGSHGRGAAVALSVLV